MLDIANSRVYITQGEYGIVAPSTDPNRISEIRSHGFSTCFALSVSDFENRVAMLSHVDIPSLCEGSVNGIISAIRLLGGQRLKMQTANFINQRGEGVSASPVLSDMEHLVQSFRQELTRAGFDIEKTRHLGRATAVKVTPNGLTIISDPLTRENHQILSFRANASYHRRIDQLLSRSQNALMESAYTPNLVLPASKS